MYSLEDLLNIVQWLAMVTTSRQHWYVAAERKDNRNWGFWLFLLSNLLWFIWAISNRAWALATMQVILAGMNIRGVKKSELKQAKKSEKENAK